MTRTDRGAGAAEVPDPGRGEARGPKSPAAPNAGRRSRRGAAARSVIAARCNGFRRVRVGRRAGCGVDGRAAAGWSGQRRDAVDGEVQAVKLGASDIDHLSNTQAWSSTSGPVGELSEARAMSRSGRVSCRLLDGMLAGSVWGSRGDTGELVGAVQDGRPGDDVEPKDQPERAGWCGQPVRLRCGCGALGELKGIQIGGRNQWRVGNGSSSRVHRRGVPAHGAELAGSAARHRRRPPVQ